MCAEVNGHHNDRPPGRPVVAHPACAGWGLGHGEDVEMSRIKDALEDMVWQFAYRGVRDGKPIMHTGGLSALESAFEALGWSDPKYFEDMEGCICDVDGCMDWVEAQGGMWRETGYWLLCRQHCDSHRKGDPQPQMKVRAIKREASRDEKGVLTHD